MYSEDNEAIPKMVSVLLCNYPELFKNPDQTPTKTIPKLKPHIRNPSLSQPMRIKGNASKKGDKNVLSYRARDKIDGQGLTVKYFVTLAPR